MQDPRRVLKMPIKAFPLLLPVRVTISKASKLIGVTSNVPEVGPLRTSTITLELPTLLPSSTFKMNL